MLQLIIPVVWKITPLISTWLASAKFLLLTPTTTILELGCGISGITALTIAPKIKSYILTDQTYIMKYLHQNLLENQSSPSTVSKSRKGNPPKFQNRRSTTNIITLPLDWETSDIPSTLSASSVSDIDIVLACDCIYNSHLIEPLVSTCANLCKLRTTDKETICIIAQQLRSPDILEEWLKAFMIDFKVWRVEDEALVEGLRPGDGFVVHFGILK